ncbi:hypothetical protein [Nocardia aurea]|uniref:DUF2079 domain-containing protein n=1 Tax=Nocardia aurea TaxID=2144174 RepID=A0ABV3FT30_9NOCA
MDTALVARSEQIPASDHAPRSENSRAGRVIVVAALCLILAQAGLRWWVARNGYFYWDDLVVVSRAARFPLLSHDLLLYDHDGHFMPLAFVTAWMVTAAAPLVWAGPVVTMLVAQLAVALAVLRLLIVLVGRRWTILVPLIFFLFSPLTLPAFAWWAAALNALPLQFALAWVIGDAVLLVRTGRRRFALSGIVVTATALLFFEKSVLVPVVAFAVAALACYVDGAGDRRGVIGELGRCARSVWRRGAALWIGSLIALVCWFAVYLTVIDTSSVHYSGNEVRGLLPGATSFGMVPTLLGGPWTWERWIPSTPWADPPGWAVAAAWAGVLALLVWSLRARRRMGPVWLLAAGYVVLAQLPVALARTGPNTAGELMQSLRYFADVAVVLTAATALFLRARPRAGFTPPRGRTVLAVTALFMVSSLFTTVTFVRSWRVSPTETYLANVASALDDWDGVPLLEQEVPWNVLNPLAYPDNLAGRVLAPIAPPGLFAESTPRLRMITDGGDIVDAVVWWNRAIVPGPEPSCGYRLTGTEPIDIPLNGPMLEHEWTAQLNYLAERDGRITVALQTGTPVVAPVRRGLNTVFVRIVGSGSALRIGSATPGLGLCIGAGPVGVASYDF